MFRYGAVERYPPRLLLYSVRAPAPLAGFNAEYRKREKEESRMTKEDRDEVMTGVWLAVLISVVLSVGVASALADHIQAEAHRYTDSVCKAAGK
jgi:hypothetical protein